MHPRLLIGPDGIEQPVFKDKQRGVQIRCYSQSGGGHFSAFYKPSAALQILLAPVAALAARGEMLYGFADIDSLHGAVNPAKTERHLDGIHVSDHTGVIGLRPVYAQPEITDFVVILLIPPIQFRARMNVKQIGYLHNISSKMTQS